MVVKYFIPSFFCRVEKLNFLTLEGLSRSVCVVKTADRIDIIRNKVVHYIHVYIEFKRIVKSLSKL